MPNYPFGIKAFLPWKLWAKHKTETEASALVWFYTNSSVLNDHMYILLWKWDKQAQKP